RNGSRADAWLAEWVPRGAIVSTDYRTHASPLNSICRFLPDWRPGVTEKSSRHDRDPVTVRQGQGLGLIYDDRLSRFNGETTAARPMNRFSRVTADRRHIESHVLLWLGNLDHDETAARAKLAGSNNGAVRPLDGFYGQDGAFANRDGLTHI